MTNITTHNNVPAADSPLSPAASAGLPRRSPLPVLMCGTFMVVLDSDATVFNGT
jgi:hypothetical protein